MEYFSRFQIRFSPFVFKAHGKKSNRIIFFDPGQENSMYLCNFGEFSSEICKD